MYNGKYGGGRMILNPLGIINDGFMELAFRPGKVDMVFGTLMFCQTGGRMCYDELFNYWRCKTAKLINRVTDG
jgi:hypothetical protein